ncbi:MAG: hypothetical protein ABI353_03775 [Isosphaeraceae bacterium]
MSLNPFRAARGRASAETLARDTPFQGIANAALAKFQGHRADLERRVRRGDLTVKVARTQAAAAAEALRDQLQQQAKGYSPAPRAFLDRLVDATQKRAKARETQSLEGLQRETNRLLRLTLTEQQLQNRANEFEGRTFVSSMSGSAPAPTLESLLAFHETATQNGDETAREWARRQLEGQRLRAFSDEDQARINQACHRPDQLSPAIVARYVEAMRGRDPEELETFVAEALSANDACACVSAFILAREAPEGAALRWVRAVFQGLGSFPDAALEALRVQEVEDRAADAEAAQAWAEHTAAQAENEARFPGLEPPTTAELARIARFDAKPTASVGEPIGLAFDRRGLTREELDDLTAPIAESD